MSGPILPRFGPGQMPGSAELNAIAAAIERALRLDVDGAGGLVGESGRAGRRLGRSRARRPLWATLSGPGPLYDWAEDLDGAPGTRSGTASAQEVNGVAGLAGNVQRLHPDGLGRYRFQSVRRGGASMTHPGVGSCPCGSTIPDTLFMNVENSFHAYQCAGVGVSTGQTYVNVPLVWQVMEGDFLAAYTSAVALGYDWPAKYTVGGSAQYGAKLRFYTNFSSYYDVIYGVSPHCVSGSYEIYAIYADHGDHASFGGPGLDLYSYYFSSFVNCLAPSPFAIGAAGWMGMPCACTYSEVAV